MLVRAFNHIIAFMPHLIKSLAWGAEIPFHPGFILTRIVTINLREFLSANYLLSQVSEFSF